jgi:hypothetical protein
MRARPHGALVCETYVLIVKMASSSTYSTCCNGERGDLKSCLGWGAHIRQRPDLVQEGSAELASEALELAAPVNMVCLGVAESLEGSFESIVAGSLL